MTAQGPLDDALAGTSCGCRSLDGYTPKPTLSWHKQIQGRNSAQEKPHFYFIEETPGWDFAVAACCLLPSPWLIASDGLLL